MPTFENGWICRECWSANREQDQRCYRCHAVPKRREMPEPITFSTPDGKPNEERKKVSSLTRAETPPSVKPMTSEPSEPATPREFALMVRLRALTATVGVAVTRVMRFLRAVRGAPFAVWQFATGKVHAGVDAVTSAVRSVLSHRRAWLTAAWLVSGFSSALLFSVALHATLAASLLVVGSVAIFSGLSAAITTNVAERRDRRAGDAREHVTARDAGAPASAEHAGQPAVILGSRPAR